MADRSTNIQYETKQANRLAVPMTDAAVLPVGTLVQVASGLADHYDGTSTLFGIVVGGENLSAAGLPTGDTSATPDPTVYVDASGPVICGIPVTGSTEVGELVYCNDSDIANATITQPTTDAPIGYIVGWRSATDADVKLFTAAEHMIGVATAHADWV